MHVHGGCAAQINAGQVEQAESLLDGILSSNPSDLSALVARGTARALRRRLKEAVEDFSRAIQIEPRWVRLAGRVAAGPRRSSGCSTGCSMARHRQLLKQLVL